MCCLLIYFILHFGYKYFIILFLYICKIYEFIQKLHSHTENSSALKNNSNIIIKLKMCLKIKNTYLVSCLKIMLKIKTLIILDILRQIEEEYTVNIYI